MGEKNKIYSNSVTHPSILFPWMANKFVSKGLILNLYCSSLKTILIYNYISSLHVPLFLLDEGKDIE